MIAAKVQHVMRFINAFMYISPQYQLSMTDAMIVLDDNSETLVEDILDVINNYVPINKWRQRKYIKVELEKMGLQNRFKSYQMMLNQIKYNKTSPSFNITQKKTCAKWLIGKTKNYEDDSGINTGIITKVKYNGKYKDIIMPIGWIITFISEYEIHAKLDIKDKKTYILNIKNNKWFETRDDY